MNVIDRKFKILAVNPVTDKRYTEANSLLLCAKDAAVPAALNAYLDECVRIGANREHIESIALLLERVLDFQIAAGGGRVPDTVGAEIPQCLNGEQVEKNEITEANLLRLLSQHTLHWEAVAAALGGICCGGVDGPVTDPYGNAGVIIAEVKRLKEGQRVASPANLAAAVRDLRGKIDQHMDDIIEPGSAVYDDLRDAKDLLGVLAHIVLGSTVAQAFGSPGDWGYGTPIGRALARR